MALYLLVLPVLFYGIHNQQHSHSKNSKAYAYHKSERHAEITIDNDSESCSLCDLYLTYDSFIHIYGGTVSIKKLPLAKGSLLVFATFSTSNSTTLRGPPNFTS